MRNRRLIFYIDSVLEYQTLIQQAFAATASAPHVQHFVNESALLEHLEIGYPLPNLILLFSHQDGINLIKSIKEHSEWRYIPVIVWGDQFTYPDILNWYLAGANAVIEKSTEWNTLVTQIDLICKYWFEIALIPKPSALGSL